MPTSKAIDTSAAPDFTPIVSHVKGDIVDIVDETRTLGSGENARNAEFVLFKLNNIEVIEAREPYTLPAFIVDVRYVRMPHSNWDVMAESIRKCGFEGDINGLINKRAEFKWTTGMLNLPKQEKDDAGNTITVRGQYEVREGTCWQILSIEGVENTSSTLGDKIAEMADGKTAEAFKSAFMSDMTLQGLSGYQDAAIQVMNNTHLDLLVQLGKLTRDDSGVYHKGA